MAKIEFGPIVSAASGSIGGTTFSRNRYGSYVRNKAIPVNPNTSYQQEVRAIMSARSQEWRGLSDDQRNQWKTWAQINPFTDVQGNSQVLQANAAYVRLNALLTQSGEPAISAPPTADAPDALTDLSFVPSQTLGTCVVTFAPTPLDADDKLVVLAAVVNSPGVAYVENLYKLTEFSAKAQATGIDAIADIEDRFGTLIIGQVVHLRCFVLDAVTGLISPPMTESEVVV